MSRFARFDVAAARRFAQLAIVNTGDDGSDLITAPPRTVEQEARHLVDGWFADLCGWPLTDLERSHRDAFLALVLDEMEGQR